MVKYIEFGTIIATHGIKGELLLDCNFDEENFDHFAENGIMIKQSNQFNKIEVKKNGIKKGGIIIQINGINNKEEAGKYLKTTFFIERSSLEALDDNDNQTHFVADLIGMEVFIEDKLYGTVIDVVKFDEEPMLEVKTQESETIFEYIPKNKEFVKKVDLTTNTIILNNIKNI